MKPTRLTLPITRLSNEGPAVSKPSPQAKSGVGWVHTNSQLTRERRFPKLLGITSEQSERSVGHHPSQMGRGDSARRFSPKTSMDGLTNNDAGCKAVTALPKALDAVRCQPRPVM
jgi:hypothetical protein